MNRLVSVASVILAVFLFFSLGLVGCVKDATEGQNAATAQNEAPKVSKKKADVTDTILVSPAMAADLTVLYQRFLINNSLVPSLIYKLSRGHRIAEIWTLESDGMVEGVNFFLVKQTDTTKIKICIPKKNASFVVVTAERKTTQAETAAILKKAAGYVAEEKKKSETEKACAKTLQGRELTQVKIFRDGVSCATGGIYFFNENYELLTAGHVFPSGLSYEYTVVFNGTTYYVTNLKQHYDDLALVSLSTKKNKFLGFSNFKNWELKGQIKARDFTFKDRAHTTKVTNLCGESFDCIGYQEEKSRFQGLGLIIQKTSLPGESGTVFFDKDGSLYILSQDYFADNSQSYAQLGIAENTKLCILRPLGVKLTHVENPDGILASPW